MHFSIPDTQEFYNEVTGSTYTGFNIYINGTFHCCLRYKQLHSLHEQLKRSVANNATTAGAAAVSGTTLPPFPPKKLLPLTNTQLEQRRSALEHYMQLVGQDPTLSKSDFLNTFLLNAQQESSSIETREIIIDVHLMNGYQISVTCYSNDCSSKLLQKACQNIDLPNNNINYYSLFLMRKDTDDAIILLRKLMDFESPYISKQVMNHCQIVIRKSYWNPCFDLQLMQDNIALNLLFIQTVSDIERDWIIVSNDIKKQLRSLQERGNKKEYIEIARQLPLYGCIQFAAALVDYPEPNVTAIISIGNKELSIRTSMGQKIYETKFRVTRMRCWRVTAIHNSEEKLTPNNSEEVTTMQTSQPAVVNNLELSFEYLMSKNCLRWITIVSEQAMLMSVCLQGMVDELIYQKDNTQITWKKESQPYQPLSYVCRDGGANRTNSCLNDIDMTLQPQSSFLPMRRKLKNKMSTTVFFRNGRESVHNEAFEGIGDDDL